MSKTRKRFDEDLVTEGNFLRSIRPGVAFARDGLGRLLTRDFDAALRFAYELSRLHGFATYAILAESGGYVVFKGDHGITVRARS